MLIDEAFRRFVATACPGFANRVYANTLPANATLWPIATIGEAGGHSGVTHSGADGCGEVRMSTVSWHTTKAGSEAAGEEVRVACHGYRGLMGGVGGVQVNSCLHKMRSDGFQPELKLYARINDFELYYNE